MTNRKKMRILFVCKFNRFRSRVAEAYFRKINKDKRIKVSSGGLLEGMYPLDPREVGVAREFKINLKGRPKNIATRFLREQDRIIIVADNVPKQIFNESYLTGKVDVWKIRDIDNDSKDDEIRKIIKEIIFHVDRLKGELENERSS